MSLQFLHNMGMPKTWAITDVFGLDEELLAMLPQPVVGLLLLFPINDKVLKNKSAQSPR
jgi:ubiquitin carboxyl-terminal hydrolase L3